MKIMDNNACKNIISPLKIPFRKQAQWTKIKILTPKKMLERLLITLAQVKAGIEPANLLNEKQHVIYSFSQTK